MKILDKLLKSNGWSSKKFAGLFLILIASIMGFLSLLMPLIVISDAITLVALFLGSGLTALGIDAYNKKNVLDAKNKV